MTTLQQRMAVVAYEKVSEVDGWPKADQDKYGTMAHKLPTLIHTAGLAQALAFVESRGKPPHHQLLRHLAQTIAFPGIDGGQDLAERSREADLDEYMLLTRRVLGALVWYKRFVESILKIEQRQDAGDLLGVDEPETTGEAS